MKKIHVMLIALSALVLSNAALANESLTNGSNTIKMTTCGQLANDVDITISSGVVGSLDCTTDTTIIGLSVCHTTGLTTERSFSTTPDTDGDGNPVCTSGTLNNDKCEGTTTGSAYPTATTAEGTVKSQYPGTNCTQDTDADAVATQAVNDAAN